MRSIPLPTTNGPWTWAGRSVTDARRKLSSQIESVLAKGLAGRLETALILDWELPADVAGAVATACAESVWLRLPDRAPGEIWLDVPASDGPGSRRFAKRTTVRVRLTPVAEDDLLVWYESGLPAMQTARLMRTLEQAERQGGQIQLQELAALHNLAINAAKERLRSLQAEGVRTAYHGRPHAMAQAERWGRVWFAVERYLEGTAPQDICALCGLSSKGLRAAVAWWTRITALAARGASPGQIVRAEGISLRELQEALAVQRRHPDVTVSLPYEEEHLFSAWPLRAHDLGGDAATLEREIGDYLLRRHGWSARRMALLTQRLRTAAAAFPRTRAADEILYEAVCGDEPLGRSLRDCTVACAKIVLASPAEGVGGARPDRITDVKRTKLVRYLTAVEKQGALLTSADLCFLLGIHMDVVGRFLKEPGGRTLPTRQREWERRATWLDDVVAAGERMLRPADRRLVAGFAQSPKRADDVAHVAEVSRLIVAGVSTADIQESAGAPRWLVDRLSQHPSVALLARLASDTPFRLAV